MTVIEYVYSQMAERAGINMMPCELIEISGDRHFLTERYDRKGGKKIHTQSLAAMNPEANSYEDLMMVCDALSLPYKEKEETFRRMVFNVLTTNVDAHIKNFSFMMEENSDWHITPAYDLTFSCYNPGNRFDPAHALRVSGKTMNIGKADLIDFGKRFSIKKPQEIISQTIDAVLQFRDLAEQTGVEPYWIDQIERHFAAMNPELLSSLTGYRPNAYSFNFDDDSVSVTDAMCEEMNNGAMRLSAKLNGNPFRVIFSPKSGITADIKSKGGIHVSKEDMAAFVKEYLLPKYLKTK